MVQTCPRLSLGLDMLGVNPTNIPVKVQRSGQVLVDFIILDPAWADIQSLSLDFRHVDNVTFHQLHVDSTAFVRIYMLLPPSIMKLNSSPNLEITFG